METSRVQPMSFESFAAWLDEAEFVKYDPNGFLLVWFGGDSTGVHIVSTMLAQVVDYYQMEHRPDDVAEVRESMERWIARCDQ